MKELFILSEVEKRALLVMERVKERQKTLEGYLRKAVVYRSKRNLDCGIIFIKGFKKDNYDRLKVLGVGFNRDGEWRDFEDNSEGILSEELIRVATTDEVTELFKAEVRKRGYLPGNYVCLYGEDLTTNELSLGESASLIVIPYQDESTGLFEVYYESIVDGRRDYIFDSSYREGGTGKVSFEWAELKTPKKPERSRERIRMSEIGSSDKTGLHFYREADLTVTIPLYSENYKDIKLSLSDLKNIRHSLELLGTKYLYTKKGLKLTAKDIDNLINYLESI